MKKLILLALGLSALMIFTACSQPDLSNTSSSTRVITIKDSKDLEKITYLNEQLNSYNGCQQISTIMDNDIYSYEVDILDLPAVKEKIKNILKDGQSAEIFLEQLKKILKKNDIKMVDKLCLKNNKTYVTLLTYIDKSESLLIATWDENKKAFFLSKPISGLMDFYYSFAPLTIDGKHIVKTGYGDAGVFQWIIYLIDTQDEEMETVEKCTGNFIYDEKIGDFTDKFELICDKEYKP